MRSFLPLLLAALLAPPAAAQMTITRPSAPAQSVQPSAVPGVPSDLPAGWRVVSGRVRAPAEVPLPGGSTVTVSLEDVTRPGGPSLSLVQASFPATRLSTPYQLQFNPVRLRPGRTYALTARVTAPGGRLLYRTTTPRPLPTARNAVQDVEVSAVR